MECGSTWQRLSADASFDNRPKQLESYSALERLAEVVLDPVFSHFGPGVLTYGCASHGLTKEIPGGIAPGVDQHAACELGPKGQLICTRRGAAVDFHVEGVSTLTVAQWLVESCDFDRVYYYGPGRPLHVSVGPDRTGQIVVMKRKGGGRLVPSVIRLDRFMALSES